jgi:hypothetical protein
MVSAFQAALAPMQEISVSGQETQNSELDATEEGKFMHIRG